VRPSARGEHVLHDRPIGRGYQHLAAVDPQFPALARTAAGAAVVGGGARREVAGPQAPPRAGEMIGRRDDGGAKGSREPDGGPPALISSGRTPPSQPSATIWASALSMTAATGPFLSQLVFRSSLGVVAAEAAAPSFGNIARCGDASGVACGCSQRLSHHGELAAAGVRCGDGKAVASPGQQPAARRPAPRLRMARVSMRQVSTAPGPRAAARRWIASGGSAAAPPDATLGA